MNHTAFLGSYARLMMKAWASEEFFAMVENEPRRALEHVGIMLPADATIEVTVLDDPRMGRVEKQVALWEEGERTGSYQLFIAHKPADYKVDDTMLSDEHLDSVSGGYETASFCSTSVSP